MVPLEQRQLIEAQIASDPLLKQFVDFLRLGKSRTPFSGGQTVDIQGNLLAALSEGNAPEFGKLANQLGKREINAESDWCRDDYLVFLLLLGKEKFKCELTFIQKLLDSRRYNPNPIPQKVNEVFASLARREFALVGEYSFLKIPFLQLLGQTDLNTEDARKSFQALIQPGLLDSFPPFLRVLALEAHDIILFQRKPLPLETAAQVLSALEQHAGGFTIGQWFRIVLSLPAKSFAILIGVFASCFAILPLMNGAGRAAFDYWMVRDEPRSMPSSLTVKDVMGATSIPPEANILLRAIMKSGQPASSASDEIFVVKSTSVNHPTTAFTVEVSNAEKPIVEAFAFVTNENKPDGGIVLIPIQRDVGRFRAVLSPQPAAINVVFVVKLELGSKENRDEFSRTFTLRALP